MLRRSISPASSRRQWRLRRSTSSFYVLLLLLCSIELVLCAAVTVQDDGPAVRRQLTPSVNIPGNWAGWPKVTVIVTQTTTGTLGAGSGSGSGSSGGDRGAGNGGSSSSSPGQLPASNGAFGTATVYTTATVHVSSGGSENTGQLLPTRTRTRTATTTLAILPTGQPDYPKDLPRLATCLPGDEAYQEPGVLSVTREQRTTLIAIPIMLAVILIGWNLVGARELLYPLKIVVILIHEAGHAFVGVLLLNRDLAFVQMDPLVGGLCQWKVPIDGSDMKGAYPHPALPAGYLFSIICGCAFILCGFDTLASKAASFLIAILLMLVATRLYPSLVGLARVIICLGLLVGLWFIEHGRFLRFYVLFVGLMSCWYVVWDFIDDYIFGRTSACCCVLHSERINLIHAFLWLWFYLALTTLFFSATIVLAIFVFRQSPHSMFCQGQDWLPT